MPVPTVGASASLAAIGGFTTRVNEPPPTATREVCTPVVLLSLPLGLAACSVNSCDGCSSSKVCGFAAAAVACAAAIIGLDGGVEVAVAAFGPLGLGGTCGPCLYVFLCML